jgi:hypothetical protein
MIHSLSGITVDNGLSIADKAMPLTAEEIRDEMNLCIEA